jgi:hypothetical protein
VFTIPCIDMERKHWHLKAFWGLAWLACNWVGSDWEVVLYIWDIGPACIYRVRRLRL